MVNLFLFRRKFRIMSKQTKIQDAIDSKLIEERKVFLWGQVDDKSAKHVIDRLMYLDALETKRYSPIY